MRALNNFGTPSTTYQLGTLTELVRALLAVKLFSARANERIGELDRNLSRLIQDACAVALGWDRYNEEFPIHILHGGGGTSANMNANEVIANLANRASGFPIGQYVPVHPLDHVNRNQSTNDVYPSSCRIAIAQSIASVTNSLYGCITAFKALRDKYSHSPRLARTCLQDAVATEWGRFFDAQSSVLSRYVNRIESSRKALCGLNLGGGVAGEPASVPDNFAAMVVDGLAGHYSHLPIRAADNYADSAQNSDDLLECASHIEGLSRTLIKIGNDLRLLASGPECGFREILLPPRQLGSTAMPGKVNPVMPEFLIQSSFTAIGLVHACGLAVDHAELDLNVWEGVFVHALISASELLAQALSTFSKYCLEGLEVNEPVSRAYAESRTARIARLARQSSYTSALKSLQSESNQSSERD